MKRHSLIIVLLIVVFGSCCKPKSERPKLIVGMVVDQMRWDYLYRFRDQFGPDGFNRLMKDGFSCQQTFINYLPAFTAPGHACIYTGSVPAIHGIAGNDWFNNQTSKACYCVDDDKVHLYGDESAAPSMSPANLLTTTITDELRLATNMSSRVYGVAIKDRASIIPAGHLANAAYWYNEKTGMFGTSTYYTNQSPGWLATFNKRKIGDSMVKQGWTLLLKPEQYKQSTADSNRYEKGYKSEKAPAFPHKFDSLTDNERNLVIKAIPAGNTYSFMMAKACINGEKLGMNGATDFLALSLSATDYIGHQFGPNSMEVQDCYLRLDRDLAAFLKYLDILFGKGNYLFFLTADHGGAHNTSFLEDRHVPAGEANGNFLYDLNSALKTQFNHDSLVLGINNYQVFLNEAVFGKPAPAATPAEPAPVQYREVRVKQGKGRHARYKTVKVPVRPAATPKAPQLAEVNRDAVKHAIVQWLGKRADVAYAIDMEDMDKTPVPEPIRTMAINGRNKLRSGPIQMILNPGWYDNGGRTTGTTHGTWNPYDTHIPLLWYGWHVPKGETNRTINMTDISATLAAMLHIQMPNGCIGKPITEITDGTHK